MIVVSALEPPAIVAGLDNVAVMGQSVEQRGGHADQRVPLIDGELAGDDGGAAAVAVLQDLQEVVAGRGIERLEAPVVKSR